MTDDFGLPILPLKRNISLLMELINEQFSTPLNTVSIIIQAADEHIRMSLRHIPPYIVILLILLFLFARGRRLAGVFLSIGLLVVWNIGSWPSAMDTVSLLLLSTFPALVIGLGIGILAAESRVARQIIGPVLDYMQTTPAFVYLIPSVLFFGVGTVPGVFATIVFAMPPFVRAVIVGLDGVPPYLIEAGQSLGFSRWQLLSKIKLPVAVPYLSAGCSQCVIMSLSMVVIASMIGARGLGTQVVESLSQMDFAMGIESGVCIVVLAMTIDRLLEASTSGNWVWRVTN